MCPESPEGYQPLGGDDHPLADGRFDESPAKWTGNGARAAQPGFNDWFETVKVNYGVRPDGSYAFDELPADAAGWSMAACRVLARQRCTRQLEEVSRHRPLLDRQGR